MKLALCFVGLLLALPAFSESDILDENEIVWDESVGNEEGIRLEDCITNRKLTVGLKDILWSRNHEFMLVMQADGNLVLYKNHLTKRPTAEWSTKTFSGGSEAVMQQDGNLVINTKEGKTIWASRTSSANARLCMQNDGNLVIYSTDNKSLWDSNSHKN